MSDAQKDFIFKLDPFNIEARYPEYKSLLAKSLNIQICENLLQKTQELQLWIKEKIS
jgi:hypothetical protein